MRRIFVAMMIVAFGAGTADASFMFMQFADGTTYKEVGVGEAVDIDIYFELVLGDTLNGVLYKNMPVPEISQTNVTTDLPGWQRNPIEVGPLGGPDQWVSLSPLPGNPPLSDAGLHKIGTQTIVCDTIGEFDLAFALTDMAIIMSDGSPYPLVSSGSIAAGAAGYLHLGSGSPGYTGAFGGVDDYQPIVLKTPEPVSFVLLAIGGMALVRRSKS